MTEFDYRLVWAPTLMSAKVIVHEQGSRQTTHTYREGATRTDTLSRCGAAPWMRRYAGPDGRTTAVHDFGALLAAGHAKTMGARFCRRCWPKGPDA